MKKVDKNLLQNLADNLLFTMSDEEYLVLQEEFEIILKQMELIGKVNNLDNIEPMTFPFEIKGNGLREDILGESLDVSDVLKNSKENKANQIKINKVV